jgi:hypothetical protein
VRRREGAYALVGDELDDAVREELEDYVIRRRAELGD